MTRKKKPTASLVRSSAAEYLTFVAASGAGGYFGELKKAHPAKPKAKPHKTIPRVNRIKNVLKSLIVSPLVGYCVAACLQLWNIAHLPVRTQTSRARWPLLYQSHN